MNLEAALLRALEGSSVETFEETQHGHP